MRLDLRESNSSEAFANEVWKNQLIHSRSVVRSLGGSPVFLAERIFHRTVQQQQFRRTEPVGLQHVAEPDAGHDQPQPEPGHDQPEPESESDSGHNEPEHDPEYDEPELRLEFQFARCVRFNLRPDGSAEWHEPEFAQLH